MILKKIIDYCNTFENPKKGAWIVFGVWCVVFTILSELDGKEYDFKIEEVVKDN